MFKRTFSKIIKYFKIMLNIIKTGNYIKNSTINSEVKEIINIREYDEERGCWLTDLNQPISEFELSNNYTYLDTGFKYTDSKNLKPLKIGLSIKDSEKFNDDLRIVDVDDNDNDFQTRTEEPKEPSSNKQVIKFENIIEHQKTEEEILFDSIIRKAKLTEEKITNFKPTNIKPKLNRLNLNIQLDFDSDMLINSCELLDIDINRFGEYLSTEILKNYFFIRKLKESILSNLEPKLLIINNNEENNKQQLSEIDNFIDSINQKYFS